MEILNTKWDYGKSVLLGRTARYTAPETSYVKYGNCVSIETDTYEYVVNDDDQFKSQSCSLVGNLVCLFGLPSGCTFSNPGGGLV